MQRQALDVILGDERNDAVLHAQTGSGKTLAFLLPLFALVNPSRSAVQGLVVVPTRELGLQVAGVAKRLAAGAGSGRDSKIQVRALRVRAVYIVDCCAGGVFQDMLRNGESKKRKESRPSAPGLRRIGLGCLRSTVQYAGYFVTIDQRWVRAEGEFGCPAWSSSPFLCDTL